MKLKKESARGCKFKYLMAEYSDEGSFFAKLRELNEERRIRYLVRAKAVRAAHPERHRASGRLSYHRHAQRRRDDARRTRQALKNNPEKLAKYREYCRLRAALKVATDPNFAIRKRMRTRIIMALGRACTRKSVGTETLLGCTIDHLRKHLESLWKPGMTWENHGRGGWHVDHIKPCNSFDLTDRAQMMACFHYTNLQPLWQAENLSKGHRTS